ncbi:MAG: hypothetical protein M3R36_00475 [Bacteroidota bacterium]|nr:hypothetical protein [Bacteroidota bacterium]
MTITARLSKFVLTSHIIFSVGWLGAVSVFVALAITGVTSQDTQLARAAYLAMEMSGWFVIVPFCLASLFTGLVQALGTKWGLFKHYWIAVKLLLTIAATILLLLHMKPISNLAGIATDISFSNTLLPGLRIQLIADAGAALLLLLATTTISIYKPWGKIKFRLRDNKQYTKVQYMRTNTKKSWRFYLLIGLITLVLLFIIMHLFGGGMGGN